MNEDNFTVSAADLESGPCSPPLAKKKAKGPNGQIGIHIHSKRNRLTDADGACGKYVIDSIVSAGILEDDRPEVVREVTHSQEKTKGPEVTEVTITGWSGYIPD